MKISPAHRSVVALLATTSALSAATFHGFGDLPGGAVSSVANAIFANGSAEGWVFTGLAFDTTRPVVENAQNSKLVITKTKLRLRGSVSDDGRVTLVEAKIGRRPFRTISATADWNLEVRVQPRMTRVKVRATDSAGNVSTIRRFIITKVFPI